VKYFTELFEPNKAEHNMERKPDKYFVAITDKPFDEFRAEVGGTHMALHKCEIIDIDGNKTVLDESIPPFDYIHWNAKIITWMPRRDLTQEDLGFIFEKICENNLGRIRQAKESFNL